MSGGEHFVTSIKKSVLFVLLCEKWLLFIEEASIYFGVGQNRLAKLASQDGCKFVVFVGNAKRIKRKKSEEFRDEPYAVRHPITSSEGLA